MYELIIGYKYLIAIVVLAVLFFIAVKLTTKQKKRTGSHSLMSYLLVWPLLMDDKEQGSSRIVKWGLVIMVLLILGSLILHPETK